MITRTQKIVAGATILVVSVLIAWLAALAFDPVRRPDVIGNQQIRSETGP
jgi:hypothetical protein